MSGTPQWKRLAVTVTLESPLALGERRPAGQPAHGLDYLPGSRLRGAVAEVLLADGLCPPAHRESDGRCVQTDCAFGRLFTGPTPARFLDALPGDATDVLPATAMTCASVPGFASQPGETAHGVFDTLIDRACWEILAPAGLLYEPRCAQRDCGERTERLQSCYVRRGVAGRLSYSVARLPTRVLARAAVERGRRVSRDDLVYTVPVVAEAHSDPTSRERALRPTVLRGEVLAPDEAAGALLAEALPRVDSLGGGRSRGLGAVRVSVADAPAPESVDARLDRFARALAVRRGQYARLAPLAAASLEGAFFSIMLRSDTLLRRGGWEPTTVLDADLLRSLTGVADPTLTLVRAYAEPGWRGGWHAAWGLPRPAELVARRGSCYLFRTTSLSSWGAALAELERVGLGARTAEGFGEVVVCDPFHLVLREQAV